METSLQVIDSFIDGERVDPDALKVALADSAGRDYFVDVWLLREAVQGEAAAEAAPPSAFTAVVVPRREPRRWMIAAAIAGALIGGYAIGYGTTGRVAAPMLGAPAPAITVSAPPATAFPVPAPTRVIQLEFHPATTAGGD